jgi:hypothetical protein
MPPPTTVADRVERPISYRARPQTMLTVLTQIPRFVSGNWVEATAAGLYPVGRAARSSLPASGSAGAQSDPSPHSSAQRAAERDGLAYRLRSTGRARGALVSAPTERKGQLSARTCQRSSVSVLRFRGSSREWRLSVSRLLYFVLRSGRTASSQPAPALRAFSLAAPK